MCILKQSGGVYRCLPSTQKCVKKNRWISDGQRDRQMDRRVIYKASKLYMAEFRWQVCGGASLVAQLLKNPPAMQETWVRSLGWEDPLEKAKATHSSILAWRIPWIVHGVTKSWIQLSDLHFQEVVCLVVNFTGLNY